MHKFIALFLAGSVSALVAQDAASARAEYQARQAIAEIPRLIQQFDQLLNNQDAIVQRLVKVESGSAENSAAQSQIDALRAEIADLRAEMRREREAMRREIVADLSRRIASMPAPAAPAPAPRASSRRADPPPAAEPAAPAYSQYYEHVVEKGQTLTLIAQGYQTTLKKILSANPGLKANALRVGQKIIIPAEEEKKGKRK